jgi:glycosyltransferase involved in cell wall biosynthesis
VKIRIYSPFVPFPVTEGAYRVIFDQTYSLLALGHQVELVTWKNTPKEFERRTHLWKTNHPSFPSSICSKLNSEKESISVAAPDFKYLGPSRDFRVLRILSSFFGKEASPERFYYPTEVQSGQKDLGYCDLAIYHYSFSHCWLRFPQTSHEEKRRVVHFHNLENELSLLQAKNSNSLKKWIHLRNFKKLKQHEEELMLLADELWFLSPVDLTTLSSYFRGSVTEKLKLVPPTFSYEISHWSKPDPSSIFKPTDLFNKSTLFLGFIGGFDFQPNRDSAIWIVEKLLPALKKTSFQGQILFAGRGAQDFLGTQSPSPLLQALPNSANIEQFFDQISWMLVPHITGSGVRIKLLDSLARKIPVMATPGAVERLHPEIQEHPLIFSSNDPDQWASKLAQEDNQGTRIKYRDLDFPHAMKGELVYRDL